MRAPALAAALAALALAAAGAASAHYADPRVRAFVVETSSSGQRVERAEASGGTASASCTFTYETLPADKVVRKDAQAAAAAAAAAPAKADPAADSLQRALEGLRGTCLTKQVDYWDYEVCLGASIRQFHLPDSYPLGHFSRWDGDMQVYDNGAACEASADAMPRRVHVKFGCGSGAPFVASVNEVEVCVYEVVIGTPAVCRFPRFPKVANAPAWGAGARRGAASAGEGRAPVVKDDGSEDWLLRLSQLPDGRFSCVVHSTEARASNSRLHFGPVSLALHVEGLPRPAAVKDEAWKRAAVRGPGRQPAADGEFDASHDPEGERGTLLRSRDSFGGKLAFAEVYA